MADSLDYKNGERFEAASEYLYQVKIRELEAQLDLYKKALEECLKELDTSIAYDESCGVLKLDPDDAEPEWQRYVGMVATSAKIRLTLKGQE